jgi:hypothetical protein
MRTSEFNSLARERLRPLLPKYEVAAGLLFVAPIAELLRGLTFQGSSFDRSSFYLVAFVQPLYVPSDEEIPTFGERSLRFATTDARDGIESFVRGPARAFLERLKTPADLAEWLERTEKGHEPDPFAFEALAYSLLLASRAQEAERWLEATAESASAYIRTDIEEGLYSEDEEHPLRAVRERTAEVRTALAASTEDAIAILERWRQETARALGLSEHLGAPERVRCRNTP